MSSTNGKGCDCCTDVEKLRRSIAEFELDNLYCKKCEIFEHRVRRCFGQREIIIDAERMYVRFCDLCDVRQLIDEYSEYVCTNFDNEDVDNNMCERCSKFVDRIREYLECFPIYQPD